MINLLTVASRRLATEIAGANKIGASLKIFPQPAFQAGWDSSTFPLRYEVAHYLLVATQTITKARQTAALGPTERQTIQACCRKTGSEMPDSNGY
jgi:hypothetical protein